jgi:hypothetical protein
LVSSINFGFLIYIDESKAKNVAFGNVKICLFFGFIKIDETVDDTTLKKYGFFFDNSGRTDGMHYKNAFLFHVCGDGGIMVDVNMRNEAIYIKTMPFFQLTIIYNTKLN